MTDSVLLDEDFWGLCRVIESILCIDIGERLYYCSPAGLFRSDKYVYLRLFSGSRTLDLLGLGREVFLLVCRDPLVFLERVLRERLIERDAFERLKDLCGVCTRVKLIMINLYSDDDSKIYLAEPLEDLERCCEETRHIARVCRAENMIIELLIHYTRRHLYVREVGEEFARRRVVIERLYRDLMRLSVIRDRELVEILDLIVRSLI
ncbi:MAG: DUF447 domain-containing protein [Sulfolobales archaeon]